jgi:alpha-tubulin suppressor-like RCC1 family protein
MNTCHMRLFHRFLHLPLLLSLFVLTICTNGHESLAAVGDIVTIAGGTVCDNGPASSAVVQPMKVATDASGNLYVADAQHHRIRKVAPSGVITTVAGTGTAGFSGDDGPATSAALNSPLGVAIDAAGNLFIADTNNHRIRKVDTTGTITTVAGNGNYGRAGDGLPAVWAELYGPGDVVVAPSGDLFIADTWNNVVRKVSGSGIISTIAGVGGWGYSGDGGPATSAAFTNIRSISVDSAGNLYLADEGNQRIRKVDGAGVVSTVAGTGTPGFNGDGIAATSAMLNYPRGVFLDSSGNLFIVDSNNNRIRKVVPDGMISTVAGNGELNFSGDGGAATSASLQQPWSATVDGSGNLFIGDTGNIRVRRVDPFGIITTFAGNGSLAYCGDSGPAVLAGLDMPNAVTMDLAGNVYFSDQGGRVRRVDTFGVITTVAGNGIQAYNGDGIQAWLASLQNPGGLVVDTLGNLYIADSGNHRIRKVDPAGIITTVAGNGTSGYNGDGFPAVFATLNNPTGLAIDGIGNLYIVDRDNNRIRKIDTAGNISTVAGNGEQGYNGDYLSAISARLNQPFSAAMDSSGNLFISDGLNGRVRKVDQSGTITTVAGNGDQGYNGDNISATAASLQNPRGISIDVWGNLYIADFNRIRMVDSSGLITTVAGNGISGFSGDNGPATAALVSFATDVVADKAHNIYLADANNFRIRKVVGSDMPAAGVIINSGAIFTKSTEVLLNLSCAGFASNCSEMQLSNDEAAWSLPVEPYVTSRSWTLSAGDGLKTVYVKFKDEAGDWSPAYSASITLDTTPPTVTLTSPTVTTTEGTPLLQYSVTDGTIVVKVDGLVVNKASGSTLDPLADGTHLVRVQAIDVAGNVGFAEVSFIVDLPPVLSIVSPAAGATNVSAPLLTYMVSKGTVVVKVDGMVVGKVSGDRLDPLADGVHTVRIEATSSGGTAFAEQTFTVDTSAPTVAISSPTTVTSGDNQPILAFTASDGAITVKVDGVVVNKSSGNRLDPMVSGTHTVEVEALDAAGNKGSATVTFTVVAPVSASDDFETGSFSRQPWITSGNGLWSVTTANKKNGFYSAEAPRSITDNQSAALEVTKDCVAGNVSFWYSVSSETNYDYLTFYIDGVFQKRWSGMVSWTKAAFAVTAGVHTFKWVYSKDGSVSAGEDTAWLDDVAFPLPVPIPTVNILSPSAGTTNNSNPLLNYTVSAGTVMVKVDDVVVNKVSGNTLDALSEGTHTVRVEATDTPNNTGIGEVTFVVDSTPPAVGIDPAATPTRINVQTVTGTRENGAVIAVQVSNSAAVGSVSYPTATTWSCTVSGLVEGANDITVTATDAATNSSSAATSIFLDTVVPTVSIASPVSGTSNQTRPILTYSVSDGTVVVKVDGVVVSKVSGTTLDTLADGGHTVRVEATDAAGNTGFASITFVVDTVTTVTLNPVSSPTRTNSQTLSGTREPGATVTVSVDTSAVIGAVSYPTSTTWSSPISGLVQGTNTTTISARDALGNTAAVTGTIVLDTTPPVVTITSPVALTNTHTPLLSYSVGDGGSVQVYVDTYGQGARNGDNLNYLADGVHTIQVVAYDTAGNVGSAQSTFTVDTLAPVASTATKIATGDLFTFAVHSSGALWATGTNSYGQLGDGTKTTQYAFEKIGNGEDWTAVSSGTGHTLALKSDGTLWAWGYNWYGQLGDSTKIDKTTPVQVGSDHDWAAVSAGGNHSVALKSDGTLWAWGDNANGAVGDGSTIHRNHPVQIGAETDWASIDAGLYHTIALKTDGSLWGWGFNTSGQLGDGTTYTRTAPVRIGASSWLRIAAGGVHTLGIKSDGTLWTWGSNYYGQLGVGGYINQFSPVQVGQENSWASVAGGRSHSIALKSDGTMSTWGRNNDGQLGDYTFVDKTYPVQIGAGANWAAIVGGDSHTVALKSDGTVWGFGANGGGQLPGIVNTANYPVQIMAAGNLKINDGASVTNSTSVNINILASDKNGVAAMQFSNDGAVWSEPETYTVLKNWTLSPGDGTKSVYAKFKDSAGNWSSVYTARITLDTAAPSVSISSPRAGLTNNNRPVLNYSVGEGAVVVTVDGIVVNKVSGATLDVLTEGLHTIRVEATDTANNSGVAEVTIVVDTVVPMLASNPVTTPTSIPSQTITGTRESNATITVSATTAAQVGAVSYPTATTWSVDVTGLVEGANTFTVAATDDASNSSSSAVTITLDTIAPQLSLTSPQAGITNSRTPVLTYTLTEGTPTVTVDGVVVTKASGDTLGPLADGSHTVRVTAVDAAGNSDFAEVSFTVDATAPTATITSPTAGTTNNATPVLSFTLSEGAAVVTVDGTVLPLNSGDVLPQLFDGPHVVRVETVDAAGNPGFAEVSFMVDTSAPNVAISSPLAGIGNNSTPVLNFTTSEGTVVVKVDGTVVIKSSGDALDPLADGFHVVRVEATDSANNFGFAETSFTIDTIAPTVTITSPAAGPTDPRPALAFTASDGVVSVRVDGAPVTTISGDRLDTLSVGPHLLRVEATDVAGNVGVAEVSFSVESYTVALNAGPNGSITGPGMVMYGDTPTYTFLPDTGYHVADVTLNGVSVGAVTSYAFTAGITANTAIAAVFAIDTFAVTMTGDLNGTVTGPATVNYGGSASYTITPATGYHVADVLVDGVSVGAVTSYSFSNVTADHTISASFAINSYNITATAGANGSISGPATVNYGGSAAYTITPATGYHVANVLVDGVSVGAVTSYSLSNVTADHTISASFAINSYNITATAGANGSISGPATANYGGSASYTITPATGYHVAEVLVDGVSVGAVTNYTFTNVATNHTISASFAASADLIATSVTGPTSATRGRSISVSSVVANQGGGNAGNFNVTFYLSLDGTITSSDTLLGTKAVTSLNAGSSTTVSGSFTVPNSMATGKYYVGVIVDSGLTVIESSETNNSKSRGSSTTVR